MSRDLQVSARPEMSPASKMSFAVSACAFAVAAIGLSINQWMAGWMAVGGIAGVGLFYLAVGLLNLGSTSSIFTEESEFIETASHRLSDAKNVVDLAIDQPEEAIGSGRTENLVNAHD